MGQVPFSIYSDLEMTSGDIDEESTLYSVSYVFVVVFHPNLDTDRIFVVTSFIHAFEQMNDVAYYPMICFHILIW